MRLSDNLTGAAFMVAAQIAFTSNDALMKFVTRTMSIDQAVVLRGIAATALIGALALGFGAFRTRPSRRDWVLIAFRTAAEIGMTWTFLSALTLSPLANLHAILQALPLTVTLAAALFLREPIGWRRLVAILVGFVGVLIIIRPGPDGFSASALYTIACVGFITARDLISRRLSAEVSSLAVSFFTAVAVTIFFALTGATSAWVALTPGSVALLGAAAVTVFLGYLFIIRAMRVGEVGFVSPFRYTGLIVALILGWAVFGDWPDALTFVGAGIVLATGMFTLYRERLQRQLDQKES